MSAEPVNVFCAGTLWHLLVLQALASGFREAGERNLLVMTRPTLDGSRLHVTGFEPYRRLLLTELWDGVLADEAVTQDYDVRAVRAGAGALMRAARAERRIERFAAAGGAVRRVLVTNPMTSAVDRRLAVWGRRRGAEVHFVEDGTGSYIPPAVKHAIDRSYWAVDGGAGVTRRAAMASLRLDRGALLPPPPFDVDLGFDASHVLFPDRFPAGPHTGRLEPVDLRRLLGVLDRLAPVVPPQPTAQDGLRVYLSRPDSEDGLLDFEDEVELVGDALAALRADGPLVLKPHPRDRRAKVAAIAARAGIDVVDADPHPAELFLTAVPVVGCYGTWSGSLIYARELLGVPARSLLPRLCRSLEARGRPAVALAELGYALGAVFPDVFAPEEP